MYNVHELQWYGFIDTWSRSWLWLRLTRQKRWQAAVSGESGATQGCVTQCVVPSTLRRSLGLPDVSIQLERCHIAGDTMQVAFFRFWDEFQKFLAAQSSGWSLRKVIQRVASLSLPRGSLSGDKHLSHLDWAELEELWGRGPNLIRIKIVISSILMHLVRREGLSARRLRTLRF